MPGEETPPLRALEVLTTLRRHDVDFVVIGGFSLAAHGFVRGTKDLDLVPAPDPENLSRMLDALRELRAEPLALGDFGADELLPLTLESLESGGNWLLCTRFGRLDVMQDVPGLPDYARLRDAAVLPEGAALPVGVRFAGLDDLIALKRAAGRPQDLIDIAELERSRRAGA